MKRSRKPSPQKRTEIWQEFQQKVQQKLTRKQHSQQEEENSIWLGLGMFGFVGWSIAIPTVIGIFIGIWIDQKWQSSYSWTLMMLFVGVMVGCWNAWYWIERERQKD
jgi:ATP synthase protein I